VTTPSTTPSEGFPGWLLAVRGSTHIRSDLRKAAHPALEQYAYRHLCRWWADKPYLKEPVLLVASAAAENHRLTQGPTSIGRLARRLTFGADGMSADGVEARLVAVQRMDLRHAHRLVSALLWAADGRGLQLDWFQLWATYRSWDDPDIQTQRNIRRKLITDFHAQPAVVADSTGNADQKAVSR
jgi:CRISPR type I-E-associated protein CasB/Cse2